MQTIKKKIDVFSVTTFEEELALIMESEIDYKNNWWISARESYMRNIEFINNLKM